MDYGVTTQELVDMLQSLENMRAKIVSDMIVHQHKGYVGVEMALLYAIKELVSELSNRGYMAERVNDAWTITDTAELRYDSGVW